MFPWHPPVPDPSANADITFSVPRFQLPGLDGCPTTAPSRLPARTHISWMKLSSKKLVPKRTLLARAAARAAPEPRGRRHSFVEVIDGKVKLNLDRLAVESFPTMPAPPEARGTIIAYRPTYCPITMPLPATIEFDTCFQPSGTACPPESCG